MYSDQNGPEILRGRPKKKFVWKYANLNYHINKKLIESKIFKDYVCHCKTQCSNFIGKEKRKEEFEKYVTLGSYEVQLLYIVNCVTDKSKKEHTTTTIKKKLTKISRNSSPEFI